jgi:Membrane bound O-acyl transferase family
LNALSTSIAARPVKQATWLGSLPLIALPATAIALRSRMPAWLFMWTLSFALFAALKWMSWWKARSEIAHTTGRSFAYLFAWPGMDAEAFLDQDRHVAQPGVREWLSAAAKTALGIVLLWSAARRVSQPLLQGWIGLLGLIFVLHFGTFHVISLFWRSIGVDAKPIMSSPIASKTLSEFWGKRWNLGFRHLAHDFIFSPLHKRIGATAAGFLVFVLSGLIHDLVISVPARAGYGLPTAYFVLQGLGVMFERSKLARRIGLQNELPSRIFTIIVTAIPAFWLFHPPFVLRVVIPFMRAIRAL